MFRLIGVNSERLIRILEDALLDSGGLRSSFLFLVVLLGLTLLLVGPLLQMRLDLLVIDPNLLVEG